MRRMRDAARARDAGRAPAGPAALALRRAASSCTLTLERAASTVPRSGANQSSVASKRFSPSAAAPGSANATASTERPVIT